MIKIIKAGIEVLVEDWPGRLGYMGLGMAAAGAMDNLALQLGNLLLKNAPGEAALEIAGGYFQLEFARDTTIAICGADMSAKLNGQLVPLWAAVSVRTGDQLSFDHFGAYGFRSYLCIAGGIDVPVYLGSKSTCLFGSYGGFDGRKLQTGDEIAFGHTAAPNLAGRRISAKYIPAYTNEWELRAIPGPNSAPDYVTQEGMDYLFSTPMKISHNANRAAYRLAEVPAYFWARQDGGKGGSHPSNIVDHGYNMRGAVNVTGNTPSLLIADGPTLGGFVCVANVIQADLWKIGQGIPSRDKIAFRLTTIEEATAARRDFITMLAAEDLIID